LIADFVPLSSRFSTLRQKDGETSFPHRGTAFPRYPPLMCCAKSAVIAAKNEERQSRCRNCLSLRIH
jgi:hypothetical protein